MVEFLAGWAGGVAGVLASHPLDTIRTRQAISGMSSSSSSSTTRQAMRPSLRSLYAGVVSPCVSVGLWKASTLGIHHRLKAEVRKWRGMAPNKELNLTDVTLTACVAGSATSSMLTPFEVIKSLTMVRSTKSDSSGGVVAQELRQLRSVLSSTGGARNLFRGMHLILLRDSYATGCFLGSYEFLFRRANAHWENGMVAGLAAGCIAGPIGWIVCYPLEVVRIRWTAADVGRWSSARNCAAELWRVEGVAGFFRGLPVACLRSSVQISVTMMCFEGLRGR
jgi:solute carrier family 25 carnitine/acylcarnitine transporter 20/29